MIKKTKLPKIKKIKVKIVKKAPATKKINIKNKFKDVMSEFKEGKLKSGSKKGPKVTRKKQALAIAFSEARRAGKKKNK